MSWGTGQRPVGRSPFQWRIWRARVITEKHSRNLKPWRPAQSRNWEEAEAIAVGQVALGGGGKGQDLESSQDAQFWRIGLHIFLVKSLKPKVRMRAGPWQQPWLPNWKAVPSPRDPRVHSFPLLLGHPT